MHPRSPRYRRSMDVPPTDGPMSSAGAEGSRPRPGPPVACPVCSTPSPVSRVQQGWGDWHLCPDCTLEFVEPRQLPRPAPTLCDRAYRGEEHGGGFEDFAHRVRQREALLVEPTLWFWSPAFEETMAWLRTRIPAGGTVLEIGCGLGFFLHAMRRGGFAPVGLDVARTAVDLNRADGFSVWHGSLDTLPTDWVQPDAVIAFFMLHHVEEPLALLQAIKRRWPDKPVALAQYGPSNVSPHSSDAPRNLTKWNGTALRRAFERAGYVAEVRDIASSGSEHDALRRSRSALFELLIRAPRMYRGAKRVIDPALSWMTRSMQQDAFVLLALATPVTSADEARSAPSAPRPSG